MAIFHNSSKQLLTLLTVLAVAILACCGPIRQAPEDDVNDVDGGLINDALDADGPVGAGNGQLNDEEVVDHNQQQPPDKPAEGQGVKVKPEAQEVNAVFEKALKLAGGANKLDAKKLEPADHLDVVKMEHDGHMNKEYHKEMFLGEEHEEFKSHPVDRAESRLREIVAKADLDKDGSLSKSEMETWVAEKMKDHFAEAKKENDHIFKHLDPDGDGFIRWKEYYVHFLLSRGFKVDDALKHVQDYDDSVELSQLDKEALISYKFRWSDADTDPTDNQLSKEEFMVFRHPEHSKQSLESLVSNVMRGLDSNNDDIVLEEEFAALPPGEVENEEFRQMDLKWQAERKKEFNEIMDINLDGKVTFDELKNYLDPTNPLQAKLEAESLMSLMDDNKDELLSMGEILKHIDLFISSKIVNFAANLHEEL